MSENVDREQTFSPEQLEVAKLTSVAQDALNFRNPEIKRLQDGSTVREYFGGKGKVVCDLSETTQADGPTTYMFGLPYVIAVNGNPELIRLNVQWSKSDTDLSRRILSGSAEALSLTDFEGPSVEKLTKVLDMQLGDPANTRRESGLQKLKRKIGRLSLH
jgi:hypothetical protein